jgi:Tfp pilus assembly protein PilF
MVHLADQVNDIEQDTASAERLYRRGIELITRHHGANSIRLLHGLNSLGRLLGAQGKDAEAEELLRQALTIRQSASSPEHPGAADQMQGLARELNRQGRTREAETLMLAALDLSRRTLGATHPVITNSRLPALAEVYERQGRHVDADRMYRQALGETPMSGVVPGEMRRSYGRMLIQRGDYAAAEEQLLSSLRLMENVYSGRTHPNAQESARALMELYERWGKPDLVERYRVPPGRYVPY